MQRYVEHLIAMLGPTIKVQCGGRAWMVPRHYIALHGFKGNELAQLAAQYKWEEVEP